jgi:ankyrin repeat protein
MSTISPLNVAALFANTFAVAEQEKIFRSALRANDRVPIDIALAAGWARKEPTATPMDISPSWVQDALGTGAPASPERRALMRELLARGAPPESRVNRGEVTPLMGAAGHDDLAVVDLLLAAGADMHRKDYDNRDAFDHAADQGLARVLSRFLDQGYIPSPEQVASLQEGILSTQDDVMNRIRQAAVSLVPSPAVLRPVTPADSFADPVVDLLLRLGWSDRYAESKGTMQWQAPHEDLMALPVTANLIVTPSYVRASVFNVLPADQLKPHYLAEWDITSGTPELARHMLAGENVPPAATSEEDTSQAIQSFTSLVLAFTRPPKIDIMGRRVKSVPPAASTDSVSPSPSGAAPR